MSGRVRVRGLWFMVKVSARIRVRVSLGFLTSLA